MQTDGTKGFDEAHLRSWWAATRYYLFADLESQPGAVAQTEDDRMPPETDADRKRYTSALWIGLALAVGACPPMASATDAAPLAPVVAPKVDDILPRPDFSGHWALNAQVSDDPLEKAKEAMQAMKQARGGGRGMVGGMGRGGGMGGGMGGGRQGRGAAGGMSGGLASGDLSTLLAMAQELHITHQDPMLLIADENDQVQRLYTDFRGASVSASGGLRQRVAVAGWEEGGLVVETTMIGKKLVQGYRIDGDTGQLVISTTANISATQPLAYRLVYDRVKPGVDAGAAARD